MDTGPSQEVVLAAREIKIDEAKRVIDEARARGIVLRLVGGLAVRFHCKGVSFCEREHGDIDLVGHRRDSNRIAGLFADLGYEERTHVRLATEGGQLQFVRRTPGASGQSQDEPPENDHVDVFLDTFKMEHSIDLTDRLDKDGYTIRVGDLLLTKLQMSDLEEKDERDVLALLHDLEFGVGDGPDSIDLALLSKLCARDWGLYHDVVSNVASLRTRLARPDSYGPLPAEDRDRVLARLAQVERAIEAEPKSRGWRLRAKAGTHLRWHERVEEQ